MDRTSISCRELLDSNTLTRGLAILAVVACHIPFAHAFWRPLWMFASAGKLAVSIFLFSSGLLLQYQANRTGEKLVLATWLRKRFFRIYPVYWVGLAFTLLCANLFRQRTFGWIDVFANVLGIPMLLGQKVVSCGYAAPFWFISLLLLCYGLFLFTYRIRRKGILVAVALLLSFGVLGIPGAMEAAVLAFPSFFMGMAMADGLRRRGEADADVRLQVLGFVPLLAVLALVFKGPNFFDLDAGNAIWLERLGCVCLTIIPRPTLYLVAFVQKSLAGISPAALRAILWLSGLSFATFCIHEPLLLVLDKCTTRGHPWFGLLGYAVLTVILAWGLETLDKRWRRMPRAG